jgi:hypothetical protein
MKDQTPFQAVTLPAAIAKTFGKRRTNLIEAREQLVSDTRAMIIRAAKGAVAEGINSKASLTKYMTFALQSFIDAMAEQCPEIAEPGFNIDSDGKVMDNSVGIYCKTKPHACGNMNTKPHACGNMNVEKTRALNTIRSYNCSIAEALSQWLDDPVFSASKAPTASTFELPSVAKGTKVPKVLDAAVQNERGFIFRLICTDDDGGLVTSTVAKARLDAMEAYLLKGARSIRKAS